MTSAGNFFLEHNAQHMAPLKTQQAKKYKKNLESLLKKLGVDKAKPRKQRGKPQGAASHWKGLNNLALKRYRKDYDKDKDWNGKGYKMTHKSPSGTTTKILNITHPLHQYNKAMNNVIRDLVKEYNKGRPKKDQYVIKGMTARKWLMREAA